MLSFSMTPGFSRVAAVTTALLRAPQPVGPVHQAVLIGLLAIESRAQEILHSVGLTLEELVDTEADWESLLQSAVEGDAALEVDSLWQTDAGLAELLSEARRRAVAVARGTEIGTEHLLAAICTVPSAVKNLLASRGLTEAGVTSQAIVQVDVTSEPIADGFSLRPMDERVARETELYRVIDAAGNRAREGLRVVEDAARLGWNDRFWTGQLKSLRHDVAGLLGQLPLLERLAARDTPGDVGTQLTTAQEQRRESVAQIAFVNLARVGEALRTLEEFTKSLSSQLAAQFKQLRYRFYTVEQGLALQWRSHERLAGCQLYLLVTSANCPRGFGPLIAAALAGGVDVVQLREKHQTDRRLLEMAHVARELTRESGALLIINDRPDIAALCDADGVHVGQDELAARDVRRIVGPDKLIGVSTHSLPQAQQALLDGADYLGVGPMFPSATKSFENHVGTDLLQTVASEISLPWFAIGGITADNLPAVLATGCSRIAVSAAICAADDPREVAAGLKSRLQPMLE